MEKSGQPGYQKGVFCRYADFQMTNFRVFGSMEEGVKDTDGSTWYSVWIDGRIYGFVHSKSVVEIMQRSDGKG